MVRQSGLSDFKAILPEEEALQPLPVCIGDVGLGNRRLVVPPFSVSPGPQVRRRSVGIVVWHLGIEGPKAKGADSLAQAAAGLADVDQLLVSDRADAVNTGIGWKGAEGIMLGLKGYPGAPGQAVVAHLISHIQQIGRSEWDVTFFVEPNSYGQFLWGQVTILTGLIAAAVIAAAVQHLHVRYRDLGGIHLDSVLVLPLTGL